MRKISLLLFVIIFLSLKSYSQCCSDAGACSVESLNFSLSEEETTSNLRLNLEQTIGLGEKFVFISQTTAGIQYKITKSSSLELRVPFIYVYGNLGHSAGVGDLLLSLNQRIVKGDNSSWNAIFATRLKTNDANKSYDGNPLPMAYQTSLGTYDIILGTFYQLKTWDFYFAYQHSFGNNQNSYLQPINITEDKKLYYESNLLKRGDDLYFRGRHHFKLKNNNHLTANALFVYRLQQDEIFKNGKYVDLAGSEGLTVNLALTYSKNLKKNRKLEYTLAFPIIDKDYRSDGLTRNIVLGIRIINL